MSEIVEDKGEIEAAIKLIADLERANRDCMDWYAQAIERAEKAERERDEARRIAESYRNADCETADEWSALPWERSHD